MSCPSGVPDGRDSAAASLRRGLELQRHRTPGWRKAPLKASLVTANGNTVWRQDFAATGWTMNFTDGYTIAAANCTTEIMQQMVTEFGSERFATALKQQ